MQKQKIAFICGPFRSSTNYGVVQNVRAAERVALEAWAAGYAVICPHLNSANFDGALPDDVWLSGYLRLLEVADIVFMVPGWEESSGSRAEVARANELGIPAWPIESIGDA